MLKNQPNKKVMGNSVKTYSLAMSELLDSIMKQNKFKVQPFTEAEVREGNTEFLDDVYRALFNMYTRINMPIFERVCKVWGLPFPESVMQFKNENPRNVLRKLYRLTSQKNASDFYSADNELNTGYMYISVVDIAEKVGYDAVTAKGRFAVRFCKYMYDNHQIKADDGFKSALGNLYNQYKESSTESTVRIVDEFDWRDGLFGKKDSCWWNCYTNSRDTLSYYGGYCLQRFDSSGEGDGRFWLLPISDNCIIGFNAYGFSNREASSIMARKLEIETGKQWVFGKRYFQNTGGDNDYPYINGDNGHNSEGGSRVFAIYTGEKPPDTITLCMDRKHGFYSRGNEYTCAYCGDDMDSDDAVDTSSGYVCSNCYDENFSCCESCGNSYDNDDMTRVYGGNYVCTRCLRRHYTQCDGCGEYMQDGDTSTFTDNDNYYCESCWSDKHQFTCEDCGNHYSDSYNDVVEVDDCLYCAECGAEKLEKQESEEK